MSFTMKYTITNKYLTAPSKRRSGKKIDNVKFIVAHDTGNEGSTAIGNVEYYESSRDEKQASAHIFVDDKNIVCCIPLNEKAVHVLNSVTTDNAMFGADANNSAIGVEYCYGGNINAKEAYSRYIWVLAYLCHTFGLDPSKHIVGHHILDPRRRTDPVNALSKTGENLQSVSPGCG